MTSGGGFDVEPDALVRFTSVVTPEAQARVSGAQALKSLTLPGDAFGKIRSSQAPVNQFGHTRDAIAVAADEGWRAVGLVAEGTSSAAEQYRAADWQIVSELLGTLDGSLGSPPLDVTSPLTSPFSPSGGP